MRSENFKRYRKWLIAPPVLLAIAVVVLLVSRRDGPERKPGQEKAHPVRVVIASPVDVVPRVLGYGTAQPGRIWMAVSEVKGRVLEVHPKLESGAMIRRDEVLLKIDPAEYQLAIARFEADIAQVQSQLEELTVQDANDRASLEIEEASLVLTERELERRKSLVLRNAVAAAEVDQHERNVLVQRQSVQKLRNSLRITPQQKKSLEALAAVKKAALEQAKLDLAKTVIKAPLDCRLTEVKIEPGQFIASGQTLFEAHGTDLSEIEIQVPMNELRNLVPPTHEIQTPIDMGTKTLQELFGFQVIVRVRSGDFLAEWDGRITRMREQLDPRTRMLGLVVEVDKPYEKAIPGQRPPLVEGMYCEAELRGRPREARIVIPRSALHDGYAYVVDSDERLHRREVEVDFVQSSFLCLRGGLPEGTRVVVSGAMPAIEGLLLAPTTDESLQREILSQATAKGSVR